MDMQILYLKQRARVLGLEFGSSDFPHPGPDEVQGFRSSSRTKHTPNGDGGGPNFWEEWRLG